MRRVRAKNAPAPQPSVILTSSRRAAYTIGGALGIACFLFWWVAVSQGGESLSDSDLPDSMIGEFNYYRLTLVVPAITLVATILLTMGREKGQSLTSNVGGVLAVLALFLVVEPLGRMALLGDLDAQAALMASGRLAIIATLIHLATKMMVDSILLEWVRGSMMSMDIDVLPEKQDSIIEGHADEAPPLV